MRQETLKLLVFTLVLASVACLLGFAHQSGARQFGWNARFAAAALVVGMTIGSFGLLARAGMLELTHSWTAWDSILTALSFGGPVVASLKPLFGLSHPGFAIAGIASIAWSIGIVHFVITKGIVRWTGTQEPFLIIAMLAGAVCGAWTGTVTIL